MGVKGIALEGQGVEMLLVVVVVVRAAAQRCAAAAAQGSKGDATIDRALQCGKTSSQAACKTL